MRNSLFPAPAGYLKWTRSARVATIDELFEFDPNTFARVFSPLEPQTGNGVDLGTHYTQGRYSGTANVYYMRLKDEIHFNPATFTNINLDPTERYGLELNGAVDVNDRLSLQGNYSYLRARFTDGPFDGNNVPLVPENKVSLSGIWRPTAATDLMVAINYVDSRYFDNDQSNSFGEKIPSYTTVDAKLSHVYKGLRMTAEVNNIFNEEYYEYGVSSTFTPGVYNAYPLPERTILFTLSKEFGNTAVITHNIKWFLCLSVAAHAAVLTAWQTACLHTGQQRPRNTPVGHTAGRRQRSSSRQRSPNQRTSLPPTIKPHHSRLKHLRAGCAQDSVEHYASRDRAMHEVKPSPAASPVSRICRQNNRYHRCGCQ